MYFINSFPISDQNNIAGQALDYQPGGKSNKGQPDKNWKETIEREQKQIDSSWRKLNTKREIKKSVIEKIVKE